MAQAATKTAAKDVRNVVEDMKSATHESAERFASGMSDLAEYGKESAAAFAESAGVASKAAEKIGAEAVAITSQTVRDGITASQELAAARNLSEWMEIQANFASKAYGDAVAKSGAMGDMARGAFENAIEFAAGRAVAFADLARGTGR